MGSVTSISTRKKLTDEEMSAREIDQMRQILAISQEFSQAPTISVKPEFGTGNVATPKIGPFFNPGSRQNDTNFVAVSNDMPLLKPGSRQFSTEQGDFNVDVDTEGNVTVSGNVTGDFDINDLMKYLTE